MQRNWKKICKVIQVAKDWTRDELAEALQVSPSTIHRWYNGSQPRLDTYEKLIALFRVSVAEIANMAPDAIFIPLEENTT